MGALQNWTWSLDGWIVIAGMLCAMSAALLGNFLVLRKLSLLGDAISHAVLPGLAIAFLISQSRNSPAMFLGSVLAGLVTALLTEWFRRQGRVDEGASMGVVFTTLFAIGLVIIVQAADQVDLDPSCVLHGAIEFTPLDLVQVLGLRIPRVVLVLAGTLGMNALFVTCFFRELKISAFDPQLANAQGIPERCMHYALMSLVAITAVASFESVGNILVVAMFVAPPATAYLCCDRLPRMILLSLVFAMLAAGLGHVAAIVVPSWFGFRSTTTAGMMAVVAGLLFSLAWLLAPRYGLLPRWLTRKTLSLRIAGEDIIAGLYRHAERCGQRPATAKVLKQELGPRPWPSGLILWWLSRLGLVKWESTGWSLTETGLRSARGIVRSHRLWETYLVHQAGTEVDRIHEMAERLEHFTGPELRERLDQVTPAHDRDPHGSPIPPE